MRNTTTLLCALLCSLSASAFAAQTLTLSLDAASAGLGKCAADIELTRNWKPGTLKDHGRRAGSEKGLRK